MADGFVGCAHALKNVRVKPVNAPVEQVAGQNVGRHARIGKDAEWRILAAGHVEGAQVVAPVQRKADNLVPRQRQARAGLLQRTHRWQQPNRWDPLQHNHIR